MSRFAVLVDAGYVRAVGDAVAGHHDPKRPTIKKLPKFIDELVKTASVFTSNETPLRTYWYDAVGYNTPAFEHTDLERKPGVKLRLGNLIDTGGRRRQKGVDGLLIADLIGLARQRAVDSVYLVAADADLTPGVVAAQELGLRIVLVELQTPANEGPARELVRHVDAVLTIPIETLAQFFIAQTGYVETSTSLAPTRLNAYLDGNWLGDAWLRYQLESRTEKLRAGTMSTLPRPLAEHVRLKLIERLPAPHLGRGVFNIDQLVEAAHQGFIDSVRIASITDAESRNERAPEPVLAAARRIGELYALDRIEGSPLLTQADETDDAALTKYGKLLLGRFHVCGGVIEALREGASAVAQQQESRPTLTP